MLATMPQYCYIQEIDRRTLAPPRLTMTNTTMSGVYVVTASFGAQTVADYSGISDMSTGIFASLNSQSVYPSVCRQESTAGDWLAFQKLKSDWIKEQGSTSSINESAMCYSYQKIIGMGPKVVPFILSELRRAANEPDQWFWALRVLTGADPISDDDRGDFPKMAETWLKWADQNYVPQLLA